MLSFFKFSCLTNITYPQIDTHEMSEGRPFLKVIYFRIGETEEQVEFWSDSSSEEVKECFRCATESDPADILKLYNTNNSLVNISPRLTPNTLDTRYTLKVVGAKKYPNSEGVSPQINDTLLSLEKRLLNLEKKIVLHSGDTPPAVWDMRAKVEKLREQLETVEHLSWLGFYKDLDGKNKKGNPVPWFGSKKSKEKLQFSQQVFHKFERLRTVELTEATKELLKKPTFDIWQWEDGEMLYLMQQMFVDLKLVDRFYIEVRSVVNWVNEWYIEWYSECSRCSKPFYSKFISVITIPPTTTSDIVSVSRRW
eukprot:sb/3467130/